MNIVLSPNFKKMTVYAVASIFIFLLVYVVLIFLAILLTILCFFIGITIIEFKAMFYTILLGIGFGGLGLVIIFFLIKFIFKRHVTDKSNMIEITKNQEPKLFKFIDEIVVEVGTDFPKKVYLSNEVNASVFYDSSFWSMFFPIRKNLHIGLGLINTVTVQEFKGILGHEFGHFSQKSMRVGSFVYNVNKIIYNLLYENDSYENAVRKWGETHAFFTIFAMAALYITNGIQWVLRKIFSIVNISYYALSREMEFYADEVAANIAGYQPMKNALMRMNLADQSYQLVLDFYGRKITDNFTSKNIFNEQTLVMKILAEKNKIKFINNFPAVTEDDLGKYQKSKLVIVDQWASHPSISERIKALEEIKIEKDLDDALPANTLFRDISKFQEKFTERIFESVQYDQPTTVLNSELFENQFNSEMEKNDFPALFNGYYDNKNPTIFDLTTIPELNDELSFEKLFSVEKVETIYELQSLQADKETLLSIERKEIKLKTFDYDGTKYRADQTGIPLKTVESRIEEIAKLLKENDEAIYRYFYTIAKKHETEMQLRNLYEAYVQADKIYDVRFEVYKELLNASSFIQEVTPIAQIEKNLKSLSGIELKLKKEIQVLLETEDIQGEISLQMRDNFNTYLSRNMIYFNTDKYYDDSLNIFSMALGDFIHLTGKSFLSAKRNLLNFLHELEMKKRTNENQ